MNSRQLGVGVTAAALTLGAGLAWARDSARTQQTQQCPSAEKAQARSMKTRQVSGTVLETKMVDINGTQLQNLVVLLKTTRNDRRLRVDLGPVNKLPTTIVPGERIAAEGRVARLGDHQVLIADRLRDDDQSYRIDRGEQLRQSRRAANNQHKGTR